MFSSFPPKKKTRGSYKKIIAPFLLFVFLFSALLVPIKPVKAQFAVVDIPKLVWDKVQEAATTLWRKGGSLAFQQTLRSALNKMAYDTANWIGSGGEGQKPLFVTQNWGAYMAQIGDEAAGTFLENFSANLSQTREDGSGLTFNFCQPSSLDVKLKISLGLSEQYRPSAPACTASQMIDNWSDAAKQYSDFKDPRFLDKVVNIFDPVSSDLGIYWGASTDMMAESYKGEEVAKNTLLGKGGWLDPLTIDGKPISLPNQSQLQLESEYQNFSQNFGEYTGDAFIDAANIFLNQLAINAFNRLVQNIGKKTGGDVAKTVDVLDGFEADPGATAGETALKEDTAKLIQPNFGIKADYSILSELSICPDANNPGPTNCVIDNKFMQAISEQKTVAEALRQGYLTGSWSFEINSLPGSYQNNFSWRNISILRKYRIVPASWEAVFEKLNQYNLAAERYPDQFQKKYATLTDLVSCYSPYDKYNEFSSQFDAADQAWCTGLIDPNWVLKSPLNYCKKEGAGTQIINKYIIPSQPAYGENPYIPSSIIVTRADNYCADNETCIKESDDGSCLAYGYCNEEKRTWVFDSETCEPIDNTCQSFIKKESEEPIAYLANTLDYEGCSAENAGCARYTTLGTYNLPVGTVTWKEGDNLYLNDKATECSNNAEGCSEFIRIKSAWGDNLVMNSDFVNDEVGDSSTGDFLNDWPVIATEAKIINIEYDDVYNDFGKALRLTGTTRALVYSDEENSLLPEDFDLIAGQAYTISADVYLKTGDRVTMALGSGVNRATYNTETKNAWRHISITKTVGDGLTSAEFSIAGYGSEVEFYVKNIKFEMSNFDTGYTPYNIRNVYQKVLPQYLAPVCYVGQTADGYSYELKKDAPDQCYSFTRQCNQSEVGCEEYTSVRDKFAVPAQVSSEDYCAGECVGYDIYVARETQFNSAQAENLIPERTDKCSVESVGCTEFTNLDALNTGGESREYYSALKHCVKPNQSECTNFYAWERTASGSQLRLYTLKMGSDGGPATIADDSGACNAEIYNATINNPLYNADCREFYNTAGEIFYHLNSQVITCSADCRAYRMTEKNYDSTLSQAECVGANKNWDSQAGACIACINGGTWSNEHQACLYQGIPQEGKACSAVENGCREYNGSAGNNVRLLDSYDFETFPGNWTSNCSGGISLANIANDRSGKSLYYNNEATSCSEIGSDKQVLAQRIPLIKQIIAGDNTAAQLKVGPYVSAGKAYNIKFWASSATGANLKIYFYNPNTGEKAEFNTNNPIKVKNGSSWQLYSANLEELNHSVAANEILVITADNSFYLDNFILTEIVDRYYLIKGSSQIPDICYYDIFDNYQGPDYNLGCSAYLDRSKTVHNLRNFSSICSQSAVGCEQVISTQNYNPYNKGIWGDDNGDGICNSGEESCLSVPADKALYLIYDKTKNCLQDDLGCSRLGEAVVGTNNSAWSDVFKKNNPNNYDNILCGASSVGCSKWRHANSSSYSYFRDPGNNTCVYRTGSINPAGQKAWYKSPMKRCDLNSDGDILDNETFGSVCLSDSDCGNVACIADRNDYLCDVSTLKTIGYGGDGGAIEVPINGAGICNASASGCTEYIDPVSKFNPDILAISLNNTVTLQANKLYSFLTKEEEVQTINNASLNFAANDVVILLESNNFSEAQNKVTIGGSVLGTTFKVLKNTTATFSGNKENVALKETAVAYQISDEVDASSCNGLVDVNNGCILFNERSVLGYTGYSSLTNGFNPYVSKNGDAPVNCDSTASSCATNKLIKVRPDRTCATWLACSTYAFDETTGQQVCYDLKQCNSLGDDGKCNNFLADNYKPNMENATGYYIPGQYSISQMSEVGLNSNAHYSFEELIPSLSCKRKDSGGACTYDSNIVKDLIIREPDKARVDYPVAGESYLRVPTAYRVSPMANNAFVNLSPGQDYFISYLVNTKNSGGRAVVELLSSGNEAKKITFTSSAPNNWERKVHKFKTETNGDFSQVIIYLSSDAIVDGEVYFDDINIEPVLAIGENSDKVVSYAARACRLYPNSDSINCRDYNKNVIAQGLEGYCLEHDKANPGVCLTWYPVDRISSSLGGTALGYNGANGLSYCTNINSNIKFAKKISTKMVYTFRDTSKGYFMGGTWDNCPNNWNDPNILENVCRYCQGYTLSTSTVAACLALSPDFKDNNEDGFLDSCTSCNRRAGWAGAIPMDNDFCGFLESAKCQEYCGDCNYYKALVINDKNENEGANYEKVFCVPNTDNAELLLVKVGGQTTARLLSEGVPQVSSCDSTYFYREAWMEYKGTLAQVPISTCEMEGESCEPIDEAANAEPPIRIYNPDYPAYDEQGLKLLSADSGDRDKVFNFTCSKFTQVVSTSGENKAWTVRVSPAADLNYAFETPDFFNDNSSSVYLNKYGRQRMGVPYGAATFDAGFDLLNSGPIYLQNQYYEKDNQEVFAGRPYGCSGKSCENVGYCSDNPNVICVYYPTSEGSHYINVKTCSDGGYGVCVPLWRPKSSFPLKYGVNAAGVLNQIFVQPYGGFTYSAGSYIPSEPGYSAYNGGSDPAVTYRNLYYNEQAITDISGNKPAGVYALKFNTLVSAEQQPLNMIYIDWGDDNTQAITGVDHHPDSSNPHVFYHYYSTSPIGKTITIKIWDNWGKTKTITKTITN